MSSIEDQIDEQVTRIFHNLVEEIIIYCFTNEIDYRYQSEGDTELKNVTNLSELVSRYTERFVNVYDENEYDDEWDSFEDWYEYLQLYVYSITMLSSMHADDVDEIRNKIKRSIMEITELLS
jgi:hypothetical protein